MTYSFGRGRVAGGEEPVGGGETKGSEASGHSLADFTERIGS
jgi:hypothetical protein